MDSDTGTGGGDEVDTLPGVTDGVRVRHVVADDIQPASVREEAGDRAGQCLDTHQAASIRRFRAGPDATVWPRRP